MGDYNTPRAVHLTATDAILDAQLLLDQAGEYRMQGEASDLLGLVGDALNEALQLIRRGQH